MSSSSSYQTSSSSSSSSSDVAASGSSGDATRYPTIAMARILSPPATVVDAVVLDVQADSYQQSNGASRSSPPAAYNAGYPAQHSAPYQPHSSPNPSNPHQSFSAPALIVPHQPVVGAMPVHFLPPGAVISNGGIMYPTPVFSRSYSVPDPAGSGNRIHYDYSIPMPPPSVATPTRAEQWNGMTRWLKVFIVILVVYWLLQFVSNWALGLCLPLLFIPSFILYRAWRRNYEHVELYMLVKLYATAFVPGALVVMLIETLLTGVFFVACFSGEISGYIDSISASGGAGKNPGAGTGGSGDGSGSGDAPSGMEFLSFAPGPGLFIFLFLLSFISAGCVEEGLKYYCTGRLVRKHRPSYADRDGYLLYALAAALGFSTCENIGYVLSGASAAAGGDSSFLGILANTMGRVLISTPLHLATGYLIGLQVVRRDLMGETLNIVQVMGPSIFFHGAFDFGLFSIMVMQLQQSKKKDGGDSELVSYILMGCVVISCFTGLCYMIWRTRAKVFGIVGGGYDRQPVSHADDGINHGAGGGAIAHDGDRSMDHADHAGGNIVQPSSSSSSHSVNGGGGGAFARLQTEEVV